MKIIAGLGNPGIEYDATRHNVGFAVVDRLARRLAPGASARGRFHAATIDADLAGERLMLLRPTTFMNRSGLSVAEAVRFYKIDPAAGLLVIVDDVALPCGAIRLRARGSAGGHNGLTDIEQKLGTDDYPRLRIGIDSPGNIPQKDYVLGRFRPDQLELIEPALEEAVDAARCWVARGIIEAMNRFNRKNTA
ncbi:MAG: aminoacyl-tRNA hydrolase [Planctomycetota bacterium]|jgi:PTH1 family peptidyl-tRNA hydrolase